MIKRLTASLVFIPVVVFSAPGVNTVVLQDAIDVPTAVAELTATLQQQGFTVPLTINHSGAAASVALELDPNQVIYARPSRRLEKHLLHKSHTIGIDLPLKFQVYEEDGEIKLAVNSIGYLIDRHQMHLHDFVMRVTNRLIQQFGTVGESGLISVQSHRSVEETVQALKDAIGVNPDARIPLVLDYGETRQKTTKSNRRRRIKPVLIVFGNPLVGTPLMKSNPQIGIDLPLEFLVWESRDGQVNISYNDPGFMTKRFNIQDQDARIEAISNALKGLAAKGAGEN
jgi:uncharacterized protein (DUF302 family)